MNEKHGHFPEGQKPPDHSHESHVPAEGKAEPFDALELLQASSKSPAEFRKSLMNNILVAKGEVPSVGESKQIIDLFKELKKSADDKD